MELTSVSSPFQDIEAMEQARVLGGLGWRQPCESLGYDIVCESASFFQFVLWQSANTSIVSTSQCAFTKEMLCYHAAWITCKIHRPHCGEEPVGGEAPKPVDAADPKACTASWPPYESSALCLIAVLVSCIAPVKSVLWGCKWGSSGHSKRDEEVAAYDDTACWW